MQSLGESRTQPSTPCSASGELGGSRSASRCVGGGGIGGMTAAGFLQIRRVRFLFQNGFAHGMTSKAPTASARHVKLVKVLHSLLTIHKLILADGTRTAVFDGMATACSQGIHRASQMENVPSGRGQLQRDGSAVGRVGRWSHDEKAAAEIGGEAGQAGVLQDGAMTGHDHPLVVGEGEGEQAGVRIDGGRGMIGGTAGLGQHQVGSVKGDRIGQWRRQRAPRQHQWIGGDEIAEADGV